MNAEDSLIDSIGRLYDVAFSGPSSESIGEVLRQAMGVESWIAFVSHHRTGELVHMLTTSSNFDEAARADYGAYYHQRNVWYQNCTVLEPPYVARGEEIVEPRSFERSEFYADWCRRVGIHHMIGCFYPVAQGRVVACGLHLPKGRGPFDDASKRRFSVLMQHMARAVQISERLGAANATQRAGFDALSGLGVGAAILDADCRPLFVNDVVQRLLRQSRWLIQRDGSLRPVDPADRARFARAVHLASLTAERSGLHSGDLFMLRDPIEGELSVLVAPSGVPEPSGHPASAAAVVLLADPDADPAPFGRDISRVFALSLAEGQLVAELVRGRSLVEAAARRGVSVNTAKAQLKSVFRKTRHTRQPDLIGEVLAHPLLRWRASATPVDAPNQVQRLPMPSA